jgi:integrase
MAKLTAAKVRSLKEPGTYSDGGGLLLKIAPTGSARWILRIQANGKRRDIGVGGARDTTLAEARARAAELRRAVRAGHDPIAERQVAKARARGVLSFRQCAEAVCEEHRPSWRNAKHAAQWMASLEAHVFPRLGEVKVNEVSGPMIRDILAEIWLTVPETARRVRQRIGTTLNWAHAKGLRDAEAPMAAVSKGLPRQPKQNHHFQAMKWAKVPSFISDLRARADVGEVVRAAVEFAVLTAARSGEVRGMTWGEADFMAAEWRIPPGRMKAGREHVVPLSEAAIAVLERMRALRTSDHPATLIFGGRKAGAPLSDMTLTKALKRMGIEATMHGFRSSFRDWTAEETSFPKEIAEAALAHAVKDKVEAAYARSDHLEKRRQLMETWGAFVIGDRRADIVPLRRPAAE